MNTFRQAFLIFVFVFVFGGLCLSEECTVPPAGSLTLAESFDPKWTAMWCSDQPMIDTLWYGLSLDETGDSWDEGWGYEDVCNNNLFLSRLFNAGFIVREVQKISKHFGEPHDGTQYLPNHDWWNFVKAREDDGYEPMCCNGETKLATHYCCATSTDLCIKWAFKRAAAPRSSTLVHEATHEDVGHIDDDDCPKGGSCDTFYGDYNATTMQINYLYDGVSAYLIETVNNQVQRQISQFTSGGKEMCKFISLLENDERNAQLTLAKEKLDNNFAYGAVFPDLGPTWDIVDDKFGTPWECKSCKLAEYTFTPGVDNKACNEVVNSANAAVNDAMQNACTQFNQNIDNSPGAEGYAQIYGEFYSKTTNKCLPYDQAALDQYCEDQQAKAKTVDDLDPYGWLSDYGYNEEFNCAADFCQERFQETWSNHAGDPNWDDPLGCLDLLCGNDPVCRKRFLTYGGDPEYYDPDYCFGELLTCYEKEGVVYEPPGRGGIENLDPALQTCQQSYKFCRMLEELKKKFAAIVIMEVWELPGPGPVEKISDVIKANPPQKAFKEALLRLKSESKKGMDEKVFNEKLQKILSYPESVAAMYSIDAPMFVAIFGTERYRNIVGPSIERVKPKLINEKKLDSRGRSLLQQLRKLDPLFGRFK